MIRHFDLPAGRQAWNLRTRRPWKTSDVTDKMVVAAYNECWHEEDYLLPDLNLDSPPPRRPLPYDILTSVLGCPLKVAYRAMERACDRGFIEYGVSLRTGWVTDAGAALFFLPTEGNA